MEIISIETDLFETFISDLNSLADEAEKLCKPEDYSLKTWMDNQDVCNILNVSKRTLQNYRDTGRIGFTQIDHKIYYKPDDVYEFLNRAKSQNT